MKCKYFKADSGEKLEESLNNFFKDKSIGFFLKYMLYSTVITQGGHLIFTALIAYEND